MIGIAISSNLQGTATLIGDPPSMLLGGFAKMNFMDFFFYKGRPSIFFAVELGALASFIVLYFIFRSHKEKAQIIPVEKVKSWVPTILLVGLVILLAVSSFFDTGFSYMAGVICMAFGVISMAWKKLINKVPVAYGIKSLDWDTTFFLIGIFVLVGGLSDSGWMDKLASGMAGWVGSNVALAFTVMVLFAVLVSGFVDNVPFLLVMIPVAQKVADQIGARFLCLCSVC